jgi:hypothetical protein
MPEDIRLPIKVVVPVATDFQRPHAGGGSRKMFGRVTPQVRKDFLHEMQLVREHFFGGLERPSVLPVVAKVILKDKALAKSHRPSSLFSQNTCPIIGGRNFGEILVSVEQEGLDRLVHRLRDDNTATGMADISTIKRIEPFRAEDAMKMTSQGEDALKQNGRIDLKFRLFHHLRPELDEIIYRAFQELLRAMRLDSEPLQYGEGQRVFRVRNAPHSAVSALANFVGTQSLSDFPLYRAVRAEAIPLREAQISDFPPPEAGEHYPVVGIVDSGVNPDDPLLTPWMVARETYVPEAYRDHHHGSFVAALVVNGKRLNHDDPRFPESRAKFVDVVAIPGRGQSIREDDLLTILEEVIPKHPNVRVWNLSLGTESHPCKDDFFSDFAAALDRIQEANNVRFVIAAGNYESPPFRGWPAEDLGESDRVRPPADSVRAVTVGSVAHVDRPNSRVKAEEPSPFSRRGPGACFLPKPELVHYGGNCDSRGQYQQTGVLSINGTRHLAENVGTSFSTPLVSTLLANIYDSLGPDASHVLSKAILVHSALLKSERMRVQDLRYKGFGIPNDLIGSLTCDPHTATLIFEPGEVRPGLEFVKGGFPIPDCLRTEEGKVRGEFVITLVYDPPLDLAYGAEYCRRNLEVSLGTYNPNGAKAEHRKKIPCEPRDISKLYEKHLVEHGFKWSPVKVYREEFPRGTEGQHWRVVVSAEDRKGPVNAKPTPVALVVTIRDTEKQLPVYDQVVARMAQSGWITQDLRVSERVRARARR